MQIESRYKFHLFPRRLCAGLCCNNDGRWWGRLGGDSGGKMRVVGFSWGPPHRRRTCRLGPGTSSCLVSLPCYLTDCGSQGLLSMESTIPSISRTESAKISNRLSSMAWEKKLTWITPANQNTWRPESVWSVGTHMEAAASGATHLSQQLALSFSVWRVSARLKSQSIKSVLCGFTELCKYSPVVIRFISPT